MMRTNNSSVTIKATRDYFMLERGTLALGRALLCIEQNRYEAADEERRVASAISKTLAKSVVPDILDRAEVLSEAAKTVADLIDRREKQE